VSVGLLERLGISRTGGRESGEEFGSEGGDLFEDFVFGEAGWVRRKREGVSVSGSFVCSSQELPEKGREIERERKRKE